jgi:NAD(P)H-nitrite reductase large subunit
MVFTMWGKNKSMAEQQHFLIVGNGIAGVTAAEVLRAEAPDANIAMIADDPTPVYYRPALKDYLAGRVRQEKLWARPANFYPELRLFGLTDHVVRIDPAGHIVWLQSGRQLAYSRLLLATGARPARLNCPGNNLTGVTTLRGVTDYQAVLQCLKTVQRVVVVGSGTLALETVESLRLRGYAVTHLMRHSILWSEVLDKMASDLVLQQEIRDEVDLRLNEEVVEITGEQGQVTGVVTSQGSRIPCELVITAIGIEPHIDWPQASGIACGRGVYIDNWMHTNVPDVFAAGDVVETSSIPSGRSRVIGQWYPSVLQARVAAYSMLGSLDNNKPYSISTYYNATFLYGLDFASVGITNVQSSQLREIIADPQPRTYKKVLLNNDVPIGMLSLGNRKGALAFKRAIDHSVNLLPVASILFADGFNLNDWLDRQGVPPPVLGVNKKVPFPEMT